MSLLTRTPAAKPLSPSQKIKELETKIELDEIARRAAFDREQEEFERNQWRTNVAEITKDRQKRVSTIKVRQTLDKIVPYLPLVIVNLAALIGQFQWAQEHLAIGTAGTPVRYLAATIYAVAAESIALFLQYYANRALRNRDSAATLYLGAFLVAGVVASINYSHYSTRPEGSTIFFGAPNATALVFAGASLISPWLWRIHARAEHREELSKAGEIDTRGVKLSLSRKLWHPIKSVKVLSMSAWTGETNPIEAVKAWESAQAAKVEEQQAKEADEPIKPKVTRKSQNGQRAVVENGDLSLHPKYTEGVTIYRKSVDAGNPLSQRQLAARLDQKNRLLASRIIGDVRREINNLRPAP